MSSQQSSERGALTASPGDGEPAGSGDSFGLERHVFYWMTQVQSRRDRQLNAELRRFRLRVPEWRVLALLKERQRLSLGEAATTVGLDHPTMSRTVDRMEKAGRIVRVSDAADMRVTRLALTAEGARLFDRVWPIVSQLNRAACKRLPEGSVPLLCLALGQMVRGLDDSWQERKDAAGTASAEAV